MHRNLLLHPLKYRQTQTPGTSSASTLMIGEFLSLHQSDGLRTAGFASTTAASHFGITVRKYKGFTLKQTLLQLQVHKGTTAVPVNARSGPVNAVFKSFRMPVKSLA